MPSKPLFLIGIDEAGRGPLAGPVSVGAAMIPFTECSAIFSSLPGICDSKKLSEKKREDMYRSMCDLRRDKKIAFVVALVSHILIDKEGIVKAVRQGIFSVLAKLSADFHSSRILLDGSLHAPEEFTDQETIIRGDETEPIISLASIAAKVVRDRKMRQLSVLYPQYGFDMHKGYGTKKHYEALEAYGISEIHRRSFLRTYPRAQNNQCLLTGRK